MQQEGVIDHVIKECSVDSKVCKRSEGLIGESENKGSNKTVGQAKETYSNVCPRTVTCDRQQKKSKSCFVCQFCGQMFDQTCHLKRHEDNHMGNKRFKCEICDKTFVTNDRLRSHSFCHKNIKGQFSCDMCGKKYKREETLKYHVKQSHERTEIEANNVCEHCDKRFVKKSDLIVHVRKHTKEKPFSCDICQKLFSKKSDVTRHRRVHTKETPYKCDLCPLSFSYLPTLKKHLCVHGSGKFEKISTSVDLSVFSNVSGKTRKEIVNLKNLKKDIKEVINKVNLPNNLFVQRKITPTETKSVDDELKSLVYEKVDEQLGTTLCDLHECYCKKDMHGSESIILKVNTSSQRNTIPVSEDLHNATFSWNSTIPLVATEASVGTNSSSVACGISKSHLISQENSATVIDNINNSTSTLPCFTLENSTLVWKNIDISSFPAENSTPDVETVNDSNLLVQSLEISTSQVDDAQLQLDTWQNSTMEDSTSQIIEDRLEHSTVEVVDSSSQIIVDTVENSPVEEEVVDSSSQIILDRVDSSTMEEVVDFTSQIYVDSPENSSVEIMCGNSLLNLGQEISVNNRKTLKIINADGSICGVEIIELNLTNERLYQLQQGGFVSI